MKKIIGAVVVLALLVGAGVIYAVTRNNSSSTNTHSSATPDVSGVNLPTSKYGMSTGIQLWTASDADAKKQIDGIAGLGAKWIRTGVRWDTVEANNANTDDWSKADFLVSTAAADHVSLIFNITGAPSWLGGDGSKKHEVDEAKYPTDYATFAAKVAARYKGRVNVFELGNEPNHAKGFGSATAAAYAALLKDSYPAIKNVAPDTTVLTAGVGGQDKAKTGEVAGDTFVQQLYDNGAKGYFDAIAYHPYSYPAMPSDTARGWSNMLHAHQIMVANGDGDKKIWVTEYGAPTAGPASAPHITEAQQAEMMKTAYQLWSGYSWGGTLCWFTYVDKGVDQTNRKNTLGVVDSNFQPKPAALTYKALTQQAS